PTVALVPAPEAPVAATPPPAPGIDANASLRRDYELAVQVGTKESFDAFIAAYPTGFYADLARAQRAKLKVTVLPAPPTPQPPPAVKTPPVAVQPPVAPPPPPPATIATTHPTPPPHPPHPPA